MEELLKLIKPEMLALMPLLIALGALIKKTKVIKSNFIPYILMGAGMLLSVVYSLAVLGQEAEFRIMAFAAFEGLVMAVSAVGGHQCYKQLAEAFKSGGGGEKEPDGPDGEPEPKPDDKDEDEPEDAGDKKE